MVSAIARCLRFARCLRYRAWSVVGCLGDGNGKLVSRSLRTRLSDHARRADNRQRGEAADNATKTAGVEPAVFVAAKQQT
jgi:hypothetical protein